MATKTKSAWDEATNFFNKSIAQPVQNFIQPAANNAFKLGQNLVNDYNNYSQQQTQQATRNQAAAANFAQDFAKQTGNAFQKAATGAGAFATNLWNNQGLPAAANLQQRVQTGKLFDPIPRNTQFDNIPLYKPFSQAGNFVANLPGAIVNSVYGQGVTAPVADVANLYKNYSQTGQYTPYNQLNSGPVKLGYQLGGMFNPAVAQQTGTPLTIQEALGNVGQTVQPIADAYLGAGLPKSFVEALAAKGGSRFLPTILRSGIENIVPGAVSGIASGLDTGRQGTLQQQVAQAGVGGLAGAGMAFAGGTILGAAGKGLSKLAQGLLGKFGQEAEVFLANKALIQKNVLGLATEAEKTQYQALNQDGSVDAFLQKAFPEYIDPQTGTFKQEFYSPQTSPLTALNSGADNQVRFRTKDYAPTTSKYNMQMGLDDLTAGEDAVKLFQQATKTNDLNTMMSDQFFEAKKTIDYLFERYISKDKKYTSQPIEYKADALQGRLDHDSGAIDNSVTHPGFENNMLTSVTGEKVTPETPIGPESGIKIKDLGPAFRTEPGGEFDMTKLEGIRALGSVFSDKEIQFITGKEGSIITPDGKMAQGSTYKTLIKVVEQNGKIESKTLFHEAFHAYANNFADRALYNEAIREAIGGGLAKDAHGAEEALAENFADFMGQRKTFSGRIQQFFQYMYEQIKSMMGRENSVNLLFGDIVAKYRSNGLLFRSGAQEAFRVGNLPQTLVHAKPRFGQTTLQFDSQIDKALYIVGNATKRSKSDGAYMAYLRTEFPGMADGEIRALGQQVKEQVKAYGPGDSTELQIPDTGVSDTHGPTAKADAVSQTVTPEKPNAPADVLEMLDQAIKADPAAAESLFNSYSQDYTMPASYDALKTANTVGLSGQDVSTEPHPDQIAQYEQQVLDELKQEVSANSLMKTPQVAQYKNVIRAAVKTWNLTKNKGNLDLAAVTERLAKNGKFSGATSLDAAVQALRDNGIEINTMDDLAALAKELPTAKGIPVGKKESRAFFSDIPPKALQDALNNPNSALRNAIRKNITDRMKNGEGGLPNDPAAKGEKLRGFVKTVRESLLTTPEVAARVQGTYKERPIDPTVQAAQEFVKNNEAEAFKQIYDPNATYDADWAGRGMALAEKLQNEGRVDEAGKVLSDVATKATLAGQGNATLKWWARMTPTGMLKYAEQEVAKARENLGIVGNFIKKENVALTTRDRQFITKEMQKINKMPDGDAKQKAILGVLERINQKIPPKASDMFEAYRYQNMLSNPRTHEKNIYSNVWQAIVTKPATLGVEGGIDFIHSALQPGRQREAYLRDVPIYYANLFNAFPTAFKAFGEALAGKQNLVNPDIQYLRANRLPKPLTIVTRLLDGEDRFFGALISAGEYAVQRGHGIAPDIAKKRAEDAASYSLFRGTLDPRNKTGQGSVLSTIDAGSQLVTQLGQKVPAVRWFVPFVRTVMNVAKQNLEYNPITGPLTMYKSTNVRQQMAKSILGGVAMGIGATYALEGKTTWQVPTDPTEKKYFFASNKKPFALNVNGTWVPMSYFGPFALALALPAAYKYFQEDSRTALTDTELEKATKVITGAVNFFSQQTFLAGIGGFVRTAQGDIDASLMKNLGFTAQQAIIGNGLLGYVAKIVDPAYRKTQGFTDTMLQNIPGYSLHEQAYTEPDGSTSTRLKNPLLSDYIMPYTLGQENSTYDGLMKDRQHELQSNAVVAQLQKSIDAQLSGDVAGASDAVGSAPGNNPATDIQGEKRLKAVSQKSNQLFDLYFKTENPEMRQRIQQQLTGMGVDFSAALEHYVNKDLEVTKKGLSEPVRQKLERSNEFTYVRRLRDTYGPLLKDDSFVNSQMEKKGITPDALQYDDATLLPDDVQLDEVKSRIEGLPSDQSMTQLIRMREISQGSRKALLTDTLIGKLEKQGVIDKDTGSFLKTIEWDDAAQTFKTLPGTDTTGGAKRTKINVARPGSVKVQSPRLSLGGTKANFAPLKPVRISRAAISKPPVVKFRQSYKPSAIQFRKPAVKTSLSSLGGKP